MCEFIGSFIQLKGMFVSYFSLVWSWALTSWPPKSNISCPCPVHHLSQLASKSVCSCSKYCVHKFGNRWTNGSVDACSGREQSPISLAWWRHNHKEQPVLCSYIL